MYVYKQIYTDSDNPIMVCNNFSFMHLPLPRITGWDLHASRLRHYWIEGVFVCVGEEASIEQH